jgi:hypothetical protein
MMSIEGSRDMPVLVFETRGYDSAWVCQQFVRVTSCRFDPASGKVEIKVGGETIMKTHQPDGECVQSLFVAAQLT